MAPTTSSGTALSRIAVWYRGTQKDMALPSQSPIGDYIAEVVDALGEDRTITAPARSQWTLARPTGPLEPSQSLQDARVDDGTALQLQAVRSTERYREVREDVIDAVAEAAATAGRPFDSAAARIAGLTALVVGGVALCVAQWQLWVSSGFSWGWVVAGAVGALVAFIGMWSAARRYEAGDAATAWTVVWVSAAAAIGQAVPVSQRTGYLGTAHLMASAAGGAVAAVCALLVTRRHLAVTSAVVSLAGALALICALVEYTELQPSAIAAAVLIAGLIGLQLAPSVSAGLARISLPKVPADGETEVEVGGEITAAELDTVRRRAHRAVQLTSGFIVAAATIAAVAAVWMMDPDSYHWKAELVIVLCTFIVLTTWGRTMSDRVQALAQFAGAAIVVLGSAARLLWARPTGWEPIVVVAVVATTITVMVVIAVVVMPRGVSPRVGRAAENLGVLALVAVYPLSAWVTGIFGVLRDLRIG
jgi:type VII secretion integral membrane protein EccD